MKLAYTFGYYLIITIIISLTMHAHGQGPVKNYNAEWKKVDELIGKGLDKDALQQVKKIYALAKLEKQDAQVIKAAVYMTQLQTENRENNAVASIKELEQEMATSTSPARSILASLVASAYYTYYQTVRWQLYNRTATVTFEKNDIATWGTEDFHEKIGALFLESIQDEAVLKKTKLDSYDAIITKGNMRQLRPTLFDLLAFRALEYFSSDERNIKKPAYAFEINTASAFDPAADFVHRKFETKDPASLEHRALLLYQRLIAFHLQDKDPGALIDADLARIQYVRQKSVHPDKDDLYFMSVAHVADQYQTTPAAAQAWYLKALYLNEKADSYKPESDSTFRFERAKALEICQKVIRENPVTEGGINAFNLSKQITRKSLSFSVEHVNLIGKPFRMLVKFKNFTKLHFRVVKLRDDLRTKLDEDQHNSKWSFLSNEQAVASWEQPLPDPKDYQDHATEVKCGGLPSGEYVLLAGSDPGFETPNAVLGVAIFHVSDISFVQRDDDFFVLNRDNGLPLKGAKVQVWKRSYDYASRRYVKNKTSLLIADQNGHFNTSLLPNNRLGAEQLLEITYQNDRLFLRENATRYYYNEEVPDQDHEAVKDIYLFTDRSLYRPGQTVYYKGIVRNGDRVLQSNREEFTAVLYNANAEHVAETKHRVNEFGSFSGSFNVPQGGLAGNFYIEIQNKYRADFRVEEYKRPRFAVSFDTLKTTYKVNEQIKITGKALAYAGNAIDGATVKYRVVRMPRIIYTWMIKRWWQPVQPMEIAHGDTVTAADGTFQVHFEAIPDQKIDRKTDPVFDYTVYADVTDSNGETRSSQTQISVSYKSYVLQADIPSKMAIDQFKSVSIRTENLAGAFVPADATIRIERILPEKRLIRNRFWEQPDLFVMTRDEYVSNFPNDEYNNETEMENWEVNGAAVGRTVSLSPATDIPVAEFALTAGFYRIQINTVNAAAEKLEDVRFIELTDPNARRLAYPQYIAPTHSKAIEPGEKGQYSVGTSAEKAFLITSTNRKSATKNFSYVTLNDEIRAFDYTASEADRGGYSVDYMFVKHNRVHTYMETITVPWTNKALKVEYETFRDKTLPGSKETWKLKNQRLPEGKGRR